MFFYTKTLYFGLFIWFACSTMVVAQVKPDTVVSVKKEKPLPKYTLKGRIVSYEDGEPLPGAHIYIGDQKIPVTVTDAKGVFSLPGLPSAEIMVSASFTGYQHRTQKYTLKADLDAGDIKLRPVVLDEVVVKERPPLAVLRGDTTQFNPGALTLAGDADLETLLKKLPGFEFIDGKIMAQGKEVKKLYVDGTEYFLNNPMVALKILPADIIATVKLYDDRTEEAKFSGYDDGIKHRALNVETKQPNKMKVFGTAAVGYGISDKVENTFKNNNYDVKLSASMFDLKRRITIDGNIQNTKQGNHLPGTQFSGGGGVNGDKNLSVNYSYNLKKKFMISGNYQGAKNDGYSASLSRQDYFPTDRYQSRVYERESHAWHGGKDHDLNLRVEYRINEQNRVTFSPSVFKNRATSRAINLGNSIENGDTVNNSNTLNRNQSDTYNIAADASWMHAFKKKGRTLTTNVNLNFNDNLSRQTQIVRERVRNKENNLHDTLRNQITTNHRQMNKWMVSLSYSEPVNDHSRFSLNYTYNADLDKSDKKSLAYRDQLFEDLIGVDTALTNLLKNGRNSSRIGLNYNYNKEKISFNGGGDISMTRMENRYFFLGTADSVVESRYIDISPRVNFNYHLKENNSLDISYNGYTNSPDARQLQDVLDVSSPLSASKGNPNLKKAYGQNLSLYLNTAKPEKSTFFSVNLSAGQTINRIAMNIKFIQQDTLVNGYQLLRGARLLQPLNLKGDWHASTGVNYSFPLEKLKLRLNTSLSYQFSHSPSIYDDLRTVSEVHNGSLGVNISSNFSENLDVQFNSVSSYSSSSNTTSGASQIFSQKVRGNARWIFWKGFFVSTDCSLVYFLNKKEGAKNKSTNMLNIQCGKKIGKNRQMEIKFALNDVLREQNEVNYSLNDLYIHTYCSTVTTNYYMLSFSYRFNSLKSKNGESQEEEMMIQNYND